MKIFLSPKIIYTLIFIVFTFISLNNLFKKKEYSILRVQVPINFENGEVLKYKSCSKKVSLKTISSTNQVINSGKSLIILISHSYEMQQLEGFVTCISKVYDNSLSQLKMKIFKRESHLSKSYKMNYFKDCYFQRNLNYCLNYNFKDSNVDIYNYILKEGGELKVKNFNKKGVTYSYKQLAKFFLGYFTILLVILRFK